LLVITTPAGQIGRQVLDNILERQADAEVRVVVRDPARLSACASDRAEVVQGSLTDSSVLTTAFAGADSVFWLLPPNPQASSVHAHILDFTRPLCAAITGQSVGRLVYVTGLNSGLATSGGPGVGAAGMDELIARTGVSYRALRAPAFMDNLLQQLEPIKHQGTFCYPVSPDLKVPAIATRDIAAVAARLLLDDTWRGQEDVPLLGAEDISYSDMAQVMSDVLDRPIRYQQVRPEAFKANLLARGIAEPWAQSLTDLLVAADHGSYDTQPRTPESTAPTTFRRWCQEVFKPAVLA
jgi:uncharacterized protein YbjT (DUF2867 family)